jgi:hypothetical protein
MAPKQVWGSRSAHRLSRSEQAVVPNLSLFEKKTFEKGKRAMGEERIETRNETEKESPH